VKIRVNVATDKIRSGMSREMEIDDEDLPTDKTARTRQLDEMAMEKMLQMISWDWEVIED
jgi:hypothetical protein